MNDGREEVEAGKRKISAAAGRALAEAAERRRGLPAAARPDHEGG